MFLSRRFSETTASVQHPICNLLEIQENVMFLVENLFCVFGWKTFFFFLWLERSYFEMLKRVPKWNASVTLKIKRLFTQYCLHFNQSQCSSLIFPHLFLGHTNMVLWQRSLLSMKTPTNTQLTPSKHVIRKHINCVI